MHEALTRPSLERAFRTMARTDLDAAGRLLLDLLPLQRVVYPHAVAYDLVLAPDRCVWVSVPNGTPTIEVQTAPAPRQEVDFQVIGEPARIARLLTAGRLAPVLRPARPRVCEVAARAWRPCRRCSALRWTSGRCIARACGPIR